MTNRRSTVKGERLREQILDAALALFNREGIEYVGVREIAAAMDMRPGHLTYYFASKEDLVLALAEGLRALNDRTVPAAETLTMRGFLDRFAQILHNHITYRCLLLSMPHLLTQWPKLTAFYQTTQAHRKDDLRTRLRALVRGGALRRLSPREMDYLVSCCSLISRGWLVECVASGHEPQTRVKHYVRLLEGMFAPFQADPCIGGVAIR